MVMKVDDIVHFAADGFIKRKYTARADARQRAMGLQYVTAEQEDLIREVASFARAMVELHKKSDL